MANGGSCECLGAHLSDLALGIWERMQTKKHSKGGSLNLDLELVVGGWWLVGRPTSLVRFGPASLALPLAVVGLARWAGPRPGCSLRVSP